jgi:LPS sulfotransferase NodH
LRRTFDLLEWILPNPTFVYLTRRDRIRQAVSAFIAKETGVFRSLPESSGAPGRPTYSYEGVLSQLAATDYGNARWRDFYATGIHPYRVEYEELAADYDATVMRLLAHLGRPGPVPPPRLRRQADAASETLVARFLRDHQAATLRQASACSAS